jgi:hypothetical protein
MDSQAMALMTAQGGVVAAAQLRALGIRSGEVRGWVRDEEIVRVRRAAFVDAVAWAGATLDERYRLRVMAVMRSREALESASHHSAVALHRLPLWHVDRELVVVTADVEESTTTSGLRVTPLRRLVSTTDVEGLSALCLADAVVTAGSVCVEAGVVAGDAGIHEGRCSLEQVKESARRLRPTLRGRARLRRVLANLDGRAESPGESRSRLVLSALGLPVESQVVVRDERGIVVARVDFMVVGRVVVEFDGAVKYAGDGGSAALVAEKAREDRLRSLGYEVVRITWDELARPELVLGRIRAALARRAA